MIRRSSITEDIMEALPRLVMQGFNLGNSLGLDYSVFAKSKNSLSMKGQAVLFFLLENEFVTKLKNGMFVFTSKAITRG